MKSIKRDDLNRLIKAFSTTYRKREKTEVRELWHTRVMGHIQDLGPLYNKTNFVEVFQQFVWKLAPVAFILALLLGAAISRIDVVSDYELTNIFMEDPEEFSLLALNGR